MTTFANAASGTRILIERMAISSSSLFERDCKPAARTTMEGKSMKRAFDWDECSKQHRPAHFAWLKANHDKPIEEAAYIAAYKSLRSSDNRPKNARRYATAKLKGSYRRLREDFGFFL
jgi:hypothetical protein